MFKNKKIILAAGIVIVIALVVFYGIKTGWWKKSVAPPSEIGSVQPPGLSTSTFPTRQEAPKNIVVPEPGATGVNVDVAIPKSSVPAGPGVEGKKLRTFDITASTGKYNPSTIIVRVGDTVHINFKVEDNTYDIVFPDYGLRQQAKQGETKVIEFQAMTDGQFTFYCENACPKGKTQGTLIVVPS